MSNATASKEKKSFYKSFVGFFDKWFPNSMVFVFILTLIVAALCLIFVHNPILTSTADKMSLVDAWVGGFWKLLSFAMQMSLIMITGFVVASTPIVKSGLIRLAKFPKTQTQALIMIGVIVMILSWIHWGIGMMTAIALGREIMVQAKLKGYKLHKNSAVACMYGLGVAGLGISQAAPLFGATSGYLISLTPVAFQEYIPAIIPLTQTVLTPKVLIQCVILFIAVMGVIIKMAPKKEENIVEISESLYKEISAGAEKEEKAPTNTPALWLNNTIWLNLIVGGFGLVWCIRLLATKGIVGLSLDNYNFIILMVGVLLSGTPARFSRLVMDAVSSTWGVIIQFPFYAGIFGLIAFTGLNEVIVGWFVAIANRETFPLIAFIYSSILNIFVPSGGSKFIIEAPYLLSVCAKLNADIPAVLLAYNCGDLTTNLIQPFWALPYIALFKMEFKDILPYTFVICAAGYIINLIYIGVVYMAGGGLAF